MLLIFLCVNNKDVNESLVLQLCCLVCVVISAPSPSLALLGICAEATLLEMGW